MEYLKICFDFLYSVLQPYGVEGIQLREGKNKLLSLGKTTLRKNRLEWRKNSWTMVMYLKSMEKKKRVQNILKGFLPVVETIQGVESRLDYLKEILNLGGYIVSNLEIKEVIKRLLLAGLEITNVHHVSILLIENDDSGFAYEMYSRDKKLRTYRSTARLTRGVSGKVLKTKKPVVINDLLKYENASPVAIKKGRRSLIAIPLFHQNRVIGIFYVDSEKPNVFNRDILERVQYIANHASIALSNARLFNEVKKLAERQTLLYNLSLSLVTTLELKKMLKNLLKELKKQMGIDYGAIVKYYKDIRVNVPIAWIGYKGLRGKTFPIVNPPDSITAYSILQRKMVYLEDVRKNEYYYKILDDIRSEVAIPLILGEEIVGAMVLSKTVLDGFAQDDLELLLTISGTLAMAIKNAELYEQTRLYAITDPLTGVANRRRIEEIIDKEIDRSIRYSRMFSLLFVDLDNFKAFNDTYGHPLGDEVLREFAGILSSKVRKIDFVGRYGGDEFVVVLVETDARKGIATAERVRKSVEESLKEYGITLSIGVSTYPLNGTTKRHLIETADNACYRAKKIGGNRVIHA